MLILCVKRPELHTCSGEYQLHGTVYSCSASRSFLMQRSERIAIPRALIHVTLGLWSFASHPCVMFLSTVHIGHGVLTDLAPLERTDCDMAFWRVVVGLAAHMFCVACTDECTNLELLPWPAVLRQGQQRHEI